MDWLEDLAERRRKLNSEYAEVEAQIEADDGGYEIELVTDETGAPLTSPILVAAGNSKGSFHIA